MSQYIPEATRQRVRVAAGNRCGYCLLPQHLLPFELEIEHLLPTKRGGANDDENLWLACRACNTYKGSQTHA